MTLEITDEEYVMILQSLEQSLETYRQSANHVTNMGDNAHYLKIYCNQIVGLINKLGKQEV